LCGSFFKAGCGNHQEEVAEGPPLSISIPAAVSTGFLSFLVLFSFFVKVAEKMLRQDRL
jgi:hypothetical protein